MTVCMEFCMLFPCLCKFLSFSSFYLNFILMFHELWSEHYLLVTQSTLHLYSSYCGWKGQKKCTKAKTSLQPIEHFYQSRKLIYKLANLQTWKFTNWFIKWKRCIQYTGSACKFVSEKQNVHLVWLLYICFRTGKSVRQVINLFCPPLSPYPLPHVI